MAGGCYAADKKVQIGDAAPGWADIVGVDDQKHALADYKEAKVLVLVFTTNHCPVAQAYQDRLIALENFINRDGASAESFDAYGIGSGLPHLQLYDRGGKLRKTFAADALPIDFRQIKRAVDELLDENR